MSDAEISSELGAAEALMKSGSVDAAVKRLKGVLSRAPDNAMALSYLALCLHDKGSYREALETARAAISAGPDKSVAHAAYGLALRATGKNDDAIAALKEALRLDPDQALPAVWLADILREKGRWAEAEGILRNANERFPDNVAVMAVLGRVLVDLKRIDEAEPFIKDALAAAPDNATALVSAGCFALAQGVGVAARCHRRFCNRTILPDQGETLSRFCPLVSLDPVLSQPFREPANACAWRLCRIPHRDPGRTQTSDAHLLCGHPRRGDVRSGGDLERPPLSQVLD